MVDAEALEVVREIVADEEGPSVIEDGEDARANVVDRGPRAVPIRAVMRAREVR